MTKLEQWLDRQEKMLEGVTEGPWMALNQLPEYLMIENDPERTQALNDILNLGHRSRTALPQALKVIRELKETIEKVKSTFYFDPKKGGACFFCEVNLMPGVVVHEAECIAEVSRKALNLNPEEIE